MVIVTTQLLRPITESTIRDQRRAGSNIMTWHLDFTVELAISFMPTSAKERLKWSCFETCTSFLFESQSACLKLGYLGQDLTWRASYLILS